MQPDNSNEPCMGLQSRSHGLPSAYVPAAAYVTLAILVVTAYKAKSRRNVACIALMTLSIGWKSGAEIVKHRVTSMCASGAVIIAFVLRRLATAKFVPMNTLVDPQCFLDPLRPMLFPCRTTHTRLFPKAHSLDYSYLFVGVPIGWTGSVGSILTSGNDSSSTWFSVHQEDYLARGTHQLGLQGKLNDYLLSQRIDPASVAGAFLVTAPLFLGFSFNPVSFWYLYDHDMLLRYMILEVNNTFDERRMYLLEHDDDKSTGKFKQEWKKDFHVSPFNDRSGFYALSAINSFAVPDVVRVDNTIVLKSEEGKPKLVARVFSTEKGIDASSLTRWRALVFVFKWWWVGFMTNPRILREARMLWVKKLQLYYRPEINAGSIGRNETSVEVIFEKAFQSYLEALVRASGHSIQYTSAAGPDRGKKKLIQTKNPNTESQSSSGPIIDIEVFTPAFYSSLARDRDIKDAFDACCFNPKDGERMAVVNEEGLSLLSELLSRSGLKIVRSGKDLTERRTCRSILNHQLRYSASIIMALCNSTYQWMRLLYGKHEPERTTLNLADYVSHNYTQPEDMDEFERASTALLFADRLAFGTTTLLRFYVSFTRWTAIILIAWQISKLLDEGYQSDKTGWINMSVMGAMLWLCS